MPVGQNYVRNMKMKYGSFKRISAFEIISLGC